MAEQNLIGIAAGLARTGFVPFATTYCVFATRRAYDFIAIDAAYGRANVKIIAGLPGLTTGYGATHQGIDDLALMRSMPNMVVIDPCDATEIEQAVQAIADYDGPVYMRCLRGSVKVVLDPMKYRFEIGSARMLRAGRDLTFVSTGLMTERALQAAADLAMEGMEAAILHVPTLKPLDSEPILEAASATGRVLTLENHSVMNGLGTAVAELLTEARVPVAFRKLGVPDRFIECGSVSYLNEKYGLAVSGIVQAAKSLVESPRARFQDAQS
jgi:transketolase